MLKKKASLMLSTAVFGLALTAAVAHAEDRCKMGRDIRGHFMVTRMALENMIDHPEQRAAACQDVVLQQRDVLKRDLRKMADFNNRVYDHRSKETDEFAYDIHTMYLTLDDLVGRDDLPKSLDALCKLIGSGSEDEVRAEAQRLLKQIDDLGATDNASGAGNRLVLRECTNENVADSHRDGARDGKVSDGKDSKGSVPSKPNGGGAPSAPPSRSGGMSSAE